MVSGEPHSTGSEAIYIHDRERYVNVNNSKSQRKIISHWVPQGSILGPASFLSYM